MYMYVPTPYILMDAGTNTFCGLYIHSGVLGRVYTVIVRACTCMFSDSLHHDEHFVSYIRIPVCRVESRDTFCAYVSVCLLTPYIVMDILSATYLFQYVG